MHYDPQLKYCLSCRDEYRAEIEKCGVCGDTLVSGSEVLNQDRQQSAIIKSRKGALTIHDDIVTIFRGSMDEAKRIEAKIVLENIGTRIITEAEPGGGCGKGCCSKDVDLQVRREDGPDAKRIIELDFEQMTGIADFSHDIVDNGYDPNAPQSICPACGFSFAAADHTCPDCGLCFG